MSDGGKGPRLRTIPEGEDRERLVCPDCGFVYYENPKVVVGSVATWEDRILLCRRDIEPRKGLWTLPAGFLELGETPEEGAKREAWEEARARLRLDALLAIYTIRHISQVQLFYRATLESPDVVAQDETQEVGLFRRDELPMGELAFPSVRWALAHHAEVQGHRVFAPRTNPADE